MTTPLVEVAETCRCGGSTSVKARTITTARRHVETWRSVHPCAAADDRGRAGSSSTLPGGPGFRPVGALGRAEVDGPERWGRPW